MTNYEAKRIYLYFGLKLLKNEHSFRMFLRNLNSIIFHQNHHKTVKNIQHSHNSVYVKCKKQIYIYMPWGFLLHAKIWMDFYEKFRKLQLFEINTIKTKAWCPPQKSHKPINQYTINTIKDIKTNNSKDQNCIQSLTPKSFSIRTLAGYSLRNPSTKAHPSIPYKSLNQR